MEETRMSRINYLEYYQLPLFLGRREGPRWIYYIWNIDAQDWKFVWGEGTR